MAGTAHAQREQPPVKAVPPVAVDLDPGDQLTVTVGCERFTFKDGSHFDVGPLSVTGRLRSDEDPSRCYTRLYQSALVLFEVEFQTKLRGFVDRWVIAGDALAEDPRA